MTCDHLRPALGAYVLGGLDPDEAAAVRRHLEVCEECAAEHDALSPMPGLLSLAGGAEKATSEPLSPAFEERLLDAYARDRAARPRRRLSWRRPRPRWLAVGAATAAVAAAAGIGIALVGEEEPSRRYDVSFQNLSGPAAANARANLESDDEGTELHLWVDGLPREEAVYEVLCDGEWTATAGTFRTDVKGSAYVVLTTALRKDEYDAIRIVRRGHRRGRQPLQAQRPDREALLNPRRAGRVEPRAPSTARELNMQRITWILALLLSAGVLLAAGCGDDEDEGGGGGAAATPEGDRGRVRRRAAGARRSR